MLCDIVFFAGTAMLIVSQFTGLYYTFDAQNVYHRAPLFPLSYLPPMLIVLLSPF